MSVKAPEKKLEGEASAAEVPTVSGDKEFYRTSPIILPKKEFMDLNKVLTVRRNLGADGGSQKFWGLQLPKPPPTSAIHVRSV